QVNLVKQDDRKLQSHDIAKLLRPHIQEIGKKFGANIKIVEVPPGPPVMSTIVAEIYGPDYDQQIAVAKQVENILNETQDVVDVDWMVEDDQIEYEFIIDKEKAMRYGVAPQQIVYTMNTALSDRPASYLYDEKAAEQVGILLALDEKEKSTIQDISQLQIVSKQGNMVSVGDLVNIKETIRAKSIFRKNQKRVVYVLADMAGELESP